MTMYDRILIVDTETGGLDPKEHSILSLGAVVWERGKVLDEFYVEIAEDEIVANKVALGINKIDVDKLRETGESPSGAVKLFLNFIMKHYNVGSEYVILGGHNLSTFDVGFVKRLFRLADIYEYDKVFSYRVMDTCGVIRFLILAGVLPLKGASSNEAFEYFDIKPEVPHHALYDAKATAELLNRLLDTTGPSQKGDVIAGPNYVS